MNNAPSAAEQQPVRSNGNSAGRLSILFLMTLPWVALASAAHGVNFGPMRHTGLFWMLSLVVATGLILIKGKRKVTFPWLVWAPFFVLVFVSLLWSRLHMKYNVQLAFQMLTFYAIGILASIAYDSEEQLTALNRPYLFALAGIGTLWAYFTLGPGRYMQGQSGGEYVGFAERPAAMSLIVIAAIFLAQFHRRPLLATIVWAASLSVAVLSGSRMVTMAVLILWLVHPRLASLKLRIATMGIMMVAGLIAFNTPIIQDRFFQKESGFSGKGSIEDVASGNFDSAGRFESWPVIIEKSQERLWFGHGVGESAPFVYRIWAPMDKPHNEYIKMFFDGGLVGLSCYVLALLGTMWNLAAINRKAAPGTNWPASAAYMATVGFILMSVFDNPLVCGVNYLHPLFALVGAANAIAARETFGELPGLSDLRLVTPINARAAQRLPDLIPLR